MSLNELLTDLKENRISIADAIVKALPKLKEKETDTTMAWLANELQGYRNPLDFYYEPNHHLPTYRVVNGALKVMNKDGSLGQLDHALANRSKFFLSAPIAWLEESAAQPGQLSITEMSELSHDIHAGQGVVVQYSRAQLQSILQEVKKKLEALLVTHS